MLVQYCFRTEHEKYFPPAVAYVASVPDDTDLSEYPADDMFHMMGFVSVSQYIEAYPRMFSVDDGSTGHWIHDRFYNDTAHIPISSTFWGTPTNLVSIAQIENECFEYPSLRVRGAFDYGVELLAGPTIKDVKKYNCNIKLNYNDLWFCSDWDGSIISRLSKRIKNVVDLLSKIRFE